MEKRFGRKERRQGGKRLEGEGERRAKVGDGSYPSHYITMNFV